jgi:hypothetical protein
MRRLVVLGLFSLLGAAGAFGLACSSNPAFVGDAGPDATGDTYVPPKDGGGSDGGGRDAAKTVCPTSPLKGECDLVAQNCAAGNECVPLQTDGGLVASCVPAKTGSLPAGTKCTKDDSCVAGTFCQAGRCTPYCCGMDDSTCGTSIPEGYAGICNLIITSGMGGTELGRVCTYSEACKPFKVAPCPMGNVCLVQDMAGTAKCVVEGNNKTEGQACSFANDCADGLYCLGVGDGGSSCTWGCYKGGGPYDAGIANAPPGQGGCPNGKTCSINVNGFPTWMGACK